MPFGQQQPVITRIPLCGTSRPPVLTKRCFKLVSDQFPIFFGNANRPDKVGITLNHKRTSFPRKR